MSFQSVVGAPAPALEGVRQLGARKEANRFFDVIDTRRWAISPRTLRSLRHPSTASPRGLQKDFGDAFKVTFRCWTYKVKPWTGDCPVQLLPSRVRLALGGRDVWAGLLACIQYEASRSASSRALSKSSGLTRNDAAPNS